MPSSLTSRSKLSPTSVAPLSGYCTQKSCHSLQPSICCESSSWSKENQYRTGLRCCPWRCFTLPAGNCANVAQVRTTRHASTLGPTRFRDDLDSVSRLANSSTTLHSRTCFIPLVTATGCSRSDSPPGSLLNFSTSQKIIGTLC